MKQRLVIAGAALIALVAAFAAGRYSAPTKVVERSVLDETLVAQAVANARAEWQRSITDKTVRRTIYRDGKPVERIVYVDREINASGSSASSFATRTTATLHLATEKTTTRERPSTRIAAGLGLDFGRPLTLDLQAAPVANLEAERRVATRGPLSLRVYGKAEAPLSNLRDFSIEAGGKLALEF